MYVCKVTSVTGPRTEECGGDGAARGRGGRSDPPRDTWGKPHTLLGFPRSSVGLGGPPCRRLREHTGLLQGWGAVPGTGTHWRGSGQGGEEVNIPRGSRLGLVGSQAKAWSPPVLCEPVPSTCLLGLSLQDAGCQAGGFMIAWPPGAPHGRGQAWRGGGEPGHWATRPLGTMGGCFS